MDLMSTFRNYVIVTVVLLMSGSCIQDIDNRMKVISFNIRYATERDGNNQWALRRSSVINFIQYENPDFVGMQEALLEQVKDIEKGLPGYQWIGVGRDDGEDEGEFSPIFFRKDRWDLIETHTFWLSESPGEPSKSWDAALPRICTWGLFRNTGSGKEVFIFNTHYDHMGTMAREKSTGLILDSLRVMTDLRNVVLTGDFNAEPDSPVITPIKNGQLEDAYHSANTRFGSKGTFNGFDISVIPDKRIDYIFHSSDLKAIHYSTDSRLIEGRFLSDHFPVITTFELF